MPSPDSNQNSSISPQRPEVERLKFNAKATAALGMLKGVMAHSQEILTAFQKEDWPVLINMAGKVESDAYLRKLVTALNNIWTMGIDSFGQSIFKAGEFSAPSAWQRARIPAGMLEVCPIAGRRLQEFGGLTFFECQQNIANWERQCSTPKEANELLKQWTNISPGSEEYAALLNVHIVSITPPIHIDLPEAKDDAAALAKLYYEEAVKLLDDFLEKVKSNRREDRSEARKRLKETMAFAKLDGGLAAKELKAVFSLLPPLYVALSAISSDAKDKGSDVDNFIPELLTKSKQRTTPITPSWDECFTRENDSIATDWQRGATIISVIRDQNIKALLNKRERASTTSSSTSHSRGESVSGLHSRASIISSVSLRKLLQELYRLERQLGEQSSEDTTRSIDAIRTPLNDIQRNPIFMGPSNEVLMDSICSIANDIHGAANSLGPSRRISLQEMANDIQETMAKSHETGAEITKVNSDSESRMVRLLSDILTIDNFLNASFASGHRSSDLLPTNELHQSLSHFDDRIKKELFNGLSDILLKHVKDTAAKLKTKIQDTKIKLSEDGLLETQIATFSMKAEDIIDRIIESKVDEKLRQASNGKPFKKEPFDLAHANGPIVSIDLHETIWIQLPTDSAATESRFMPILREHQDKTVNYKVGAQFTPPRQKRFGIGKPRVFRKS